MNAYSATLRRQQGADAIFAAAAVLIGVLAAFSLKFAVAALVAAAVIAFMSLRPSAFVPLLITSVFFGAVTFGSLTMARVVGPIALLVAVVHALRTGTLGLRGTTIHRWIAAYGLLCVASLLWTWDEESTRGLIVSLLLAVTYMLAITGLTRTRDDLQLAMATFPFAAIALSAMGLVAFQTYGGALAAQTLIGDRNFFAAFLVVAIPPSVAFYVQARATWMRVVAVVAVAMSVAGVVISGSQGGMLALLGIALLGLAIAPPPRWRRRLLPLLVVLVPAVIVAITLILTSAGPGTGGAGGTQAAITKASVDRVNLWLGAVHAFREEPLVGVGFGAYAPNSAQLMLETPGVDLKNYNLPDHPQEAHNTYLESLAELGPLGLALFLGIIVNTAYVLGRIARRSRRVGDLQMTATSLALLTSLFGFAIASFFLSVQTNRGWWVIFALTIACAHILLEESESAAPRAAS